MGIRQSTILLCTLLMLHTIPAGADVVTLVNGDRFTGKLMEREGKKMVFRTEYAGSLRIKWEFVEKLSVDQPASLILDNGEIISALEIRIKGDQISYQSSIDNQLHDIDAEVIVGISPEAWELNKTGISTGTVNLSLKSERGNGSADFADFDFKYSYHRKLNRIKFSGEWEHDTKQKQSTGEIQISKNEWSLRGSYDKFIDKKTYISYLGIIDSDDITDLIRRVSMGPLYGYQFNQSRSKNLLVEAGLLWVDENYGQPLDDAFWQPAWHLDYDQFFNSRRIQFYHEHYGNISVSSTDRWLFRSWTGFRIPLQNGYQVSFEYKLEYESDPVEETIDSTETTFRVKLGYKW
jgi:hypothetical protein